MAYQCQAVTRDGTACQAYAGAGSPYCYHHDPARADERRVARSKGGLARHGRHIGSVGQTEPLPIDSMAEVAHVLKHTINQTLQLENSLQRARTVGYLISVLTKVLDLAMIEQRLTELERTLKNREKT